jgi:glycerol-3-phosphate dehydrogenase
MLAGRYGHAADRVLALAAADPKLAAPIMAELPDLLAEAPFAAWHEQARTVGDVVLRRTRLGLLAGRELCAPGAGAPRRVAEAMGAALGWGAARVDAEVARFAEEARAEGIAVAFDSQPA